MTMNPPRRSFEKIGRQDLEVQNFLSTEDNSRQPDSRQPDARQPNFKHPSFKHPSSIQNSVPSSAPGSFLSGDTEENKSTSQSYLAPKQYIEPEVTGLKGIDFSNFWYFLQRRKWLGMLVGAVLLVILLILFVSRGGGEAGVDPQEFLVPISEALPDLEVKQTDSTEIKVHIVGAVKNPGVYGVEAGSRVDDLIRMAGGVLAGAYADALNLASKVNDGDKICIPVRIEITPSGEIEIGGCEVHLASQSSGTSGSGILNINTASASDLEALAGIGPSRAQDIISYRQKQGDFKNVNELGNISGITQSVIDKFKDLVSVQ